MFSLVSHHEAQAKVSSQLPYWQARAAVSVDSGVVRFVGGWEHGQGLS